MTGSDSREARIKDSVFRFVDSDDSGTIDAREFAVLYDAIKKDLEEDLEKQAALEKEASSATRRFKMLLLFVAVLVSFLAASVAANFAVLFTFVDSAITTVTTSSGLLEAKGSDTIIKTAIATQDVPLMAAPALHIDTLSEVKSLKVVYSSTLGERIEAQLTVVGVRKHNSTFVEFVTSVGGETVEALNGVASLVRYPTNANRLTTPIKHAICSANATCSAFRTRGIDVGAALAVARAELEKSGFKNAARRLSPTLDTADCFFGWWTWSACGVFGGLLCPYGSVMNAVAYFYTGYSWFATRHVVFFAHGWKGTAAHMWMMYCTFGVMWCPILELDAFRHLIFVFPTSFINGYLAPSTETAGNGGWGLAWNHPLDNSLKFEMGTDQLATLMCGNSNAFELEWCWGLGWLGLFGVDQSSEVMIIGFSNGGGLATFANWAYGNTITKAVAIDYHAYADYDVWMPAVFASSGAAGLDLKLYEACASWTFSTDGIWPLSAGDLTFGSGANTVVDNCDLSVTSPPLVGFDPLCYKMYGGFGYGYLQYKEFSFSEPAPGTRKFKWAVHGFNATNHCALNEMALDSEPGNVHMFVPYFSGIVKDTLEWVSGSSSSGKGGGKGPGFIPKPSPPSPAPPPFPPTSTWFLGIKPINVDPGHVYKSSKLSWDDDAPTPPVSIPGTTFASTFKRALSLSSLCSKKKGNQCEGDKGSLVDESDLNDYSVDQISGLTRGSVDAVANFCAPAERRRQLRMEMPPPRGEPEPPRGEMPPAGKPPAGVVMARGDGSGSGKVVPDGYFKVEKDYSFDETVKKELGGMSQDVFEKYMNAPAEVLFSMDVDPEMVRTMQRNIKREKYFIKDADGNEESILRAERIAYEFGSGEMAKYKEDPVMMEVFGMPVEPGMSPEEYQTEVDLVILSSLAAEELIHELNKPKEQALMASYEEALFAEQEKKAAMLIYVPPPPPPAVTETVITEEKKLELEAQGIEVEAGVTLTLCDETGLPANQTDTFSNTMDPPPVRELASALEDQFGARGGFELFNASSSGLKYPFLECKASNGCFAQSDGDSQKEHLATLDEIRNEMDVGFDAGFKAMNNLAKSVEIIGAPSMRIFGTGIACFSRTTQACRLLQPASAEDAFAACFQDGHVATAERVSMDKLVAGDTVLANAAALTRVVVNQHATVKAAAPMLTLHFEGGSLSLTADHVLQLDGALSPARLAAVGSVLSSGRKVSAVTRSSEEVVNPITAAGTILAAGPMGEPAVAATANEWLADVLLSAYPKYTLSFNLAILFPASVQAYYDSLLEPFFSLAVPRLEQVKAVAPMPAVAAGLALGDALLAAGFVVFALGKVAVVAVAIVAAVRLSGKA